MPKKTAKKPPNLPVGTSLVTKGIYNPEAWQQAVSNVIQGDNLPTALIKVGFAKSYAETKGIAKLRALVKDRLEELTKDYIDRSKMNLRYIGQAETSLVKDLVKDHAKLPKAAAIVKQIKQSAGVLGADPLAQTVVQVGTLNVLQQHISGKLSERDQDVIDVDSEAKS